MKQITFRFACKTLLTLFIVVFFQAISWAQDTKVEVNGTDVGSWFGRNWLWVAGVIVLLVLLLLFSGGSSRASRSKTTTYRRGDGTVTRTTTTETDSES